MLANFLSKIRFFFVRIAVGAVLGRPPSRFFPSGGLGAAVPRAPGEIGGAGAHLIEGSGGALPPQQECGGLGGALPPQQKFFQRSEQIVFFDSRFFFYGYKY